MYKISTRGQYALLIMTDLAENEGKGYTPLKTLSHRRNLSTKYLEQILIQLGKNGLVSASMQIRLLKTSYQKKALSQMRIKI